MVRGVSFRVREDCRLCGERRLTKVLELPPTPLANEFPSSPGKAQDEFPLWLAQCAGCGHVQLPVVVDPERLFREYVYVSGTSPVFVDHFRRYAAECQQHLDPGDLVVEIGSNDGTLLRFFKEGGQRVLGVDPAVQIALRATAEGIDTWPAFFNAKTAEAILDAHGPAKLVVANNVFAHADDLAGIVRGVRKILRPDGAFVFEVSYLPDVIRGTLFDTIYHEHLAFHSVEPLVGFFRQFGMSLVGARRVPTHGGSVRVMVVPEPNAVTQASASALIEEEQVMGLSVHSTERIGARPVPFVEFERRIAERREEALRTLRGARMAGKRIAAYGAPAKATTLLRTFGLEEMIEFVVDDAPLKQGRWLPGGHVPVLPSAAIEERKPDYLVLLAWNFADSILDKLAPYRAAGGTCLVPLPKVRVVT